MKTKLKKKLKLDKEDKEEKQEIDLDINLSDELLELHKQMNKLSGDIKEYTNYRKAFTVSVVRGFGMAIGASLIVAALIYILDKVISMLDYIPVLSPLIEYLQTVLETL